MENFNASNLVRLMKKSAGWNIAEVAASIGKSEGYFNNKLYRNSWKTEELFKVADICCCDLIYSDGYLEVFNHDGLKIGTFKL